MTLPQSWSEVTIEDVTAYVSRGRSPKYVDRSCLPVINQRAVRWSGVDSQHLKFVDVATANQWGEERTLRIGDVLLNSTGTGTIGRAALYTPLEGFDRVVADSHVTVVRAAGQVESSYLFQFIRSPVVQNLIEEMQSGSTNQVELNRRAILDIFIPLPPAAEQRRIVAKLDTLTAGLARARAELDRVPVLAGNLRATALTDTYDRLLKDFPTVSVRDLITSLDQGWSPKCENFPSLDDDTWAVLKTTAIQALEFRPEENKALPSNLRPRPHIQVEEGDVLVTRAGPRVRCGITCLVSKTRKRLMLADKMFRLRCKPDHAMPAYLVLMLNAPPILAMIEAMKTGISDSGLNLTQKKFLSLPIPAASLETQESIEANLQTAFAHADRLEAEAARARALLDRLESTILAKAFRGELVPQDPDDEPASVLLDRIRAERAVVPSCRRRNAGVVPQERPDHADPPQHLEGRWDADRAARVRARE